MAHVSDEGDAAYIQKVKDDIRDLYTHLPEYRHFTIQSLRIQSDFDFPMNLQRCMFFFWEYKEIDSDKYNWVTKDVSEPNALRMIQDDVLPLLKDRYPYGPYRPLEHKLETLWKYIESWGVAHAWMPHDGGPC